MAGMMCMQGSQLVHLGAMKGQVCGVSVALQAVAGFE